MSDYSSVSSVTDISFVSSPATSDDSVPLTHDVTFSCTSPTNASVSTPLSITSVPLTHDGSAGCASPAVNTSVSATASLRTPTSLQRSNSVRSSRSSGKASTISSATSAGKMLDRFLGAAVRPKRKYESLIRNLKYKEDDALNPKRMKKLGAEDILCALQTTCCKLKCMSKFSVDQLTDCRARYVQSTRATCNAKLMTVIETGLRAKMEIDGKQMYVLPSGNWVCGKACALAFGVSDKTFKRRKDEVLAGAITWVQLPQTNPRGMWAGVVVPWIEALAELLGNRMPDNGKIELAVGNKMQIYHKFLVEHEEEPDFAGKEMISVSHFYSLWPKHITTPKETRFTKCDICRTFKDNLSGPGSHAQRVAWVKDFDIHLEHQMLERKQYYANREHARNHPDEAISIIIDGAAQELHHLPLFGRNPPKKTFGLQGYDLHVMGALVHHYGPQIYLHDCTTETGPNLAIEVLYRTLCQIPVDKLPPLLYLQLDNTPADNKNHHVFEFCTWLVESGIFKEVAKIWTQNILTAYLLQPLVFFLPGTSRVFDGWTHS